MMSYIYCLLVTWYKSENAWYIIFWPLCSFCLTLPLFIGNHPSWVCNILSICNEGKCYLPTIAPFWKSSDSVLVCLLTHPCSNTQINTWLVSLLANTRACFPQQGNSPGKQRPALFIFLVTYFSFCIHTLSFWLSSLSLLCLPPWVQCQLKGQRLSEWCILLKQAAK